LPHCQYNLFIKLSYNSVTIVIFILVVILNRKFTRTIPNKCVYNSDRNKSLKLGRIDIVKRILLWIFLLSSLLTSCNYPTRARRSPGGLSASNLRATLQAQKSPGVPLGTSTALPVVLPATQSPSFATASPPPTPTPGEAPLTYIYMVQVGDTLPAVALRFDVSTDQIGADISLPGEGFLPGGILLKIPNHLNKTLPAALLLPDGELVNSPDAVDFDIQAFIDQAGGYLSTYQEPVEGQTVSGAAIVKRVAVETSINPRLLLALLEFRSGWVLGQPSNPKALVYPLGFGVPGHRGLYEELKIAATHLGIGYYGWRDGSWLEVTFQDGRSGRLDPQINAGTAGLENLFSKFYNQAEWEEKLFGQDSFLSLYRAIFGDYWARAAAIGPLFPEGLSQPALQLPFAAGESWSLTGGPHRSWNTGSPLGALDFSPITGGGVCAVSSAWATAVAPGIVARAENNVVALDLDGDGNEQTGWVVIYLHVAKEGMIAAGTRVAQDAPLGHPSCEGGAATGKHVHLARKYNGEWLATDGPLPMELGGWQVIAGKQIYQGELIKDGQVVEAYPGGGRRTLIQRPKP
jgi:LasA protease